MIVIISFNTKNFRVQLHRYSVSHCFPLLVTMSLGILWIFVEICGFWLIVMMEYLLWHRNLHCDDCYHHQESYADTFYVSYMSCLTSELFYGGIGSGWQFIYVYLYHPYIYHCIICLYIRVSIAVILLGRNKALDIVV